MTQVVGGRPHHLQLADELVGRDESLAGDMAAAFRHDLVLEMRGGDAGPDVKVGGALDVEQVSIPRVHVHHHRRNLEVDGRDVLVGVSHRHRQLELAQGAHGPPRAVGDLD